MTAFIVQRRPPRAGREGGRQLDYRRATLSPGPHLSSGRRLLFLPSGSRTQSHTGEQEPELLLWGSTGKWALVSEMGAVLEPVCTGVFQTPPQGVNQGNSRTGPHAHCSHLQAAPHSKVFLSSTWWQNQLFMVLDVSLLL